MDMNNLTNIERVTSILDETMIKKRVEDDLSRYFGEYIELTDKQWDELDEMFTDNMKDLIWKTYYYSIHCFKDKLKRKEWSDYVDQIPRI